jgi:hypothetical protein
VIFYIVAFVSWSCPGGWFSGLVPEKVRPFACDAQAQVEVYDRLNAAKVRVFERGPSASLMACRGLRCKKVPVVWVTEPTFAEVRP